jgi:NAD(P)-dependent dehydrogenase (short-subunit alcohol dehydrogenase family)
VTTVPVLDGRVAIVTGGGRGLGRAICHSLASAGASVIVADIDEAGADETARAVRDGGGHAAPAAVDVADERSVAALLQRAESRLDILVNCAGIDRTVSIEELPVSDWDRILSVNLRGPFLMSRAAMARMRPAARGHIVNIVSTAAKRAWANASAYHASKWGLLGFTHALHVEARPLGIKVTAMVCGGMCTPFLLDRFPDIDRTTLQAPENVAEAVRFVLSTPAESVIPEMMVLPMRETSWP